MTQYEKWQSRYKEVVDYIDNHCNPSKHRIEEHNMLLWCKQQRKLLNAGRLKNKEIGTIPETFWKYGKKINTKSILIDDGSQPDGWLFIDYMGFGFVYWSIKLLSFAIYVFNLVILPIRKKIVNLPYNCEIYGIGNAKKYG